MRLARLLVFGVIVTATGCHNRHVNGTTARPNQTCDRSWIATVDNTGTDRYYDLYIGDRVVGTAEPRRISRITIDPAFGTVTPLLRVGRTSRDEKGAVLRGSALRMSCE